MNRVDNIRREGMREHGDGPGEGHYHGQARECGHGGWGDTHITNKSLPLWDNQIGEGGGDVRFAETMMMMMKTMMMSMMTTSRTGKSLWE